MKLGPDATYIKQLKNIKLTEGKKNNSMKQR